MREQNSICQPQERPLAGASKPDLAGAIWSFVAGGSAAELKHISKEIPDQPLKFIAAALCAEDSAAAVAQFDRALQLAPFHPVAAANRALALSQGGRTHEAVAQARQALAILERPHLDLAEFLDCPLYPVGLHEMRAQWDAAAAFPFTERNGEIRAKRCILRSLLHALLAELTGDLVHYAEAVLALPELAANRAALGRALARANRHDEALPHLRAAEKSVHPDATSARAFLPCEPDSVDQVAAKLPVESGRRLSVAAPAMAASEKSVDDVTPSAPTMSRAITADEFEHRFGPLDTSRAVCGYTNAADTHIVLSLLVHCRARRVLEIGAAMGHMTANLAEWTKDDAVIYAMGDVAGVPPGHAGGQSSETPSRALFGKHADSFGKAHKVLFITADSLHYDFARLAPLDFVFIDGSHDFQHARSDTVKAYEALAPGGWLCRHDFHSPTPWVEVRQAILAAGLAETVFHVEGTQVAFLQKRSGDHSSAAPAVIPLCIVWEGDVERVHSLAGVNRAFCERLTHRGSAVSVKPVDTVAAGKPGTAWPAARLIGKRLPRCADVCVRHRWPPDFARPENGKLVIFQPWEYGSLPSAWVEGCNGSAVDEVWAPTHFVRDCFVKSGVDSRKVHVVPQGVDVSVFRPGLAPYRLATTKRFRFLFVGGTIRRKGFDVLLAAYDRTFTAADDVCLVVKDMGVGTFYRGQTADKAIRDYRARNDAPEVEYITGDLSEADMVGLYNACQCLVHPFRGEGFGLTIAEAMACGLPVIVTDYGAPRDWCDRTNAFLIPAREVRFAQKRVDKLQTVDYPWLAEPSVDALRDLLRRVLSDPRETAAKARAGCAAVRGRLTWDHAAAIAERRLRELTGANATPDALPVGHDATIRVRTPPKVSLTMIVKNEEINLPDCLRSVGDLVDEIVIVDTGSTDGTREIARAAGAKVIERPWPDSFSVARNVSLELAGGDWIFWMDADDRLDAGNRAKLKNLFAGLDLENRAFVMKCLCVAAEPGATETVVDHLRLFRNNPKHRWKYRVHEQILPSIRVTKGDVQWSDVVIRHLGYADRSLRRKKLERDLRLLQLEQAELPDEPFNLFNLGSVYLELQQPAEALPVLRRSLERSKPKDSIVRKLYALLVQSHRKLGQTDEALAACVEGRRHYPEDAELLFAESLTLREKGDLSSAEQRLKQLLAGREEGYFASVDTGLRGYKARHNLAVIYLEKNRVAEAEQQWREAIREEPAFLPAQIGLGEALLRRDDSPKLQVHTDALRRLGARGEEEAMILDGQSKLRHGEFAAARSHFGSALKAFPNSLRLRKLHAEAVLKEGVDDRAAEAALRAVLEIDSTNKSAEHNLALLLARNAR